MNSLHLQPCLCDSLAPCAQEKQHVLFITTNEAIFQVSEMHELHCRRKNQQENVVECLPPLRGASAVQDAITQHVPVGIKNGQQHCVRDSKIDMTTTFNNWKQSRGTKIHFVVLS